MSSDIQIFPVKDAAAAVFLRFEFLSQIRAGVNIAAPHSVVVSVYSGTDPNPSALLSGTTSIIGTSVQQKIIGGIAGNIYSLQCSCSDTLGETLIKVGLLAILAS